MKWLAFLMTRGVFCAVLMYSGSVVGQIKEITALKGGIPALADSADRVMVYARLGMLYTNRSLDSCYYYSARALDLAKRIGNRQGEAEALNVLGFYYMERGNPYLAYKCVNESLSIFEKQKNAEKVCELIMNIGVLLGREGKHNQAVEHFRKAYKKSEKLHNDSIKPLVALNLAGGLSFQSTYDDKEVRHLLDEAEQLAGQQGNTRFLISIKQARNAIRFHSAAPLDEVIREQYGVIRQTQQYGFEFYTAVSYMELGNMYLPVSLDSALHYYELGVVLAERTGYSVLHYHSLAQAYQALSQLQPIPPIAQEYSRRLLALSRERELENQKEGMDFLQLTIREQGLAIEEVQHRLRRMWLIAAIVVCVLALGFAFWVYRLYRLKRGLAKHLKESNDKLEVQNQQLEENNAFHQKLISMLSHDLRQPFASMLMMGDGEMLAHMREEDLRFIFKQMHQTAQTSLQIMDGLLHWMKLQVIGLAYTPSAVNLKENLEEALAFNRAAAEQKNIEIMIFVPSETGILAQSEMLLFVNRNLLHNAVKHTPDGGQIVITATPSSEGQYTVVRFSDSGHGIPEQLLPLLFVKERPEAAGANTGSGLALIICHEMISRMDGQICAANNPEGGASLYYSLPLAQPTVTSTAISGASVATP